MEVLWSIFWILAVLIFYIFLQWRMKWKERRGEYCRISSYLPQMLIYPQPDQNNIFNISGRIQGQNQTQFPEGYLSIEHITITNELNKPPKYDDAPPSYEEAIKLAMAQSNSIQTFQAEQAQTGPQPQSSTSAAPTTITVVVPAVPNRTTE